MKFQVRKKKPSDRRKWDIPTTYKNRLDVVKAIGKSFSPKEAREMEKGKWYALKKNIQVRTLD